MDKINTADIDWEKMRSPRGKFGLDRKNITLAMGAPKDIGRPNGHAIDIALHRLPPGLRNFPLHNHSQQTECYLIISGRGKLRLRRPDGQETLEPLSPGDCLHCPPDGDAHQIMNDGDEDLVFWTIADNPPDDYAYYPDSDKHFIRSRQSRVWFRPQTVDYYDGEE